MTGHGGEKNSPTILDLYAEHEEPHLRFLSCCISITLPLYCSSRSEPPSGWTGTRKTRLISTSTTEKGVPLTLPFLYPDGSFRLLRIQYKQFRMNCNVDISCLKSLPGLKHDETFTPFSVHQSDSAGLPFLPASSRRSHLRQARIRSPEEWH